MSSDTVLITDEAGKVCDLVSRKDAGDQIQWVDGILSPGLINCHCHLELSHLRGQIPPHSGLIRFLLDIIQHRSASADLIMQAIQEAENEMYQNGIVAVGDICNTRHTLAQKNKERLHYHNFIEVAGFSTNMAAERFNQMKVLYEEFAAQWQHSSIVPHAPYSVSNELLDNIYQFSKNEILSIHNQESPAEDEFFKTKTGDFLSLYEQLNIDTSPFNATGKSSIQSILSHLKKEIPTIFVHNACTKNADIDFIQAYYGDHFSSVFFCLCPNANEYISKSLPEVDIFQQYDSHLVLGTDSLASNHQLNLLEEIKTLHTSFPHVSVFQMLTWATINGARALNIADQYGSFEIGKKPGLVAIRELKPTRLL